MTADSVDARESAAGAAVAVDGSVARKLLVLDAAYSLEEIRERKLEHSMTSRDLNGFFSYVWSVNPLTGADARGTKTQVGSVRTVQLDGHNTFVEGRVGRYRWLTKVPLVNFLVAQLKLLVYLQALIRRHRIDVVRAGDPYFLGLLGLVLTRRNRIPLVVRINGDYDAIYEETGRPAYPRLFRWRGVEKLIERFVLSRADLVAGANENNRRFAIRNGADPRRTTVFRYGSLIDPVHFRPTDARAGLGARRPLAGRDFVIYIGRLETLKHPDDVLAAFVQAREDVPGLGLVFVGDGGLRRDLELQVQDLGVADDVVFAGNQNQLWIQAALTDAAVVACPLTGRALVEAALAAKPIVAYDVEWHAELLRDGENSLLVPYRDIRSLGRGIVSLCIDRQKAVALGAAARETAMKLMDPQILLEHERQQYAAVLNSAAEAGAVRRGR